RFNILKYRMGTAHFLAVSSRVRDVLVDDGVPSDRISVVPSSADMARFAGVDSTGLRDEMGLSPAARLVVNVGSLVGHKAHIHLVRAMPRVIERCPDVYCLIVGDGPLRPQIEAEIRALRLGGRILLAGFRRDALRFTKMADVFAISSEMEGLCSSILEALAQGIIRVLEDPSLAHRLAAEGTKTVLRDFTSERMVASTLQVYRDVIG
ncbi:MAG: glycosyltransferase family 4 protein, partial [Chthoniobacteraceae bacterium]|nr:glycosyltransferase family 4 protein [Chthoniobacteraceae bacterium]